MTPRLTYLSFHRSEGCDNSITASAYVSGAVSIVSTGRGRLWSEVRVSKHGPYLCDFLALFQKGGLRVDFVSRQSSYPQHVEQRQNAHFKTSFIQSATST